MAKAACVFWILLAVQSAVAVDLEESRRIVNGENFCGLDDQSRRTHNLHHFIPLIEAMKPDMQTLEAVSFNIWICQRPFGTEHGNHPQFMTFYNTRNKIPVYSIYKTDITWTDDGTRATALPRKGGFETAAQISTIAPAPIYLEWSTELPNQQAFTNSWFDRGHLFADNYATDQAQQKATYRITNAVAQDHDFNNKQWRFAESWLMKNGMFMCKHPGGDISKIEGSPYILTGAVTGRQGQNGQPGFQNGARYQIEYGDNEVMQVPTHMWTTMLCLNQNGGINHMSFIGSNYQDGQVVFYTSFGDFTSDLTAMYGGTGNMFQHLPSQPVDGAYTLPNVVCGVNTIVCTHTGPIIDNWRNLLVPVVRANLLIERLMSSMKVLGHGAEYVFWKLKETSGASILEIIKLLLNNCNPDLTDVCEADKFIQYFIVQAQRNAGSRKKRELPSQSGAPSKTSYMFLEVIDTDPARDLNLSECTLTEVDTNTTLVIDEHTIDMKNMKHYEETVDGSVVEVKSMMPNGTETRMPKSVQKEQNINIVLAPRRTP